MLKLLLQFVISGTVVVLATMLGQRVGQKWAGLLVAFPIWTILTYIFLSLGSKASHREYLIASVVFMVPAAVFIVALLWLSRANMWTALLVGLAMYIVTAWAVANFVL